MIRESYKDFRRMSPPQARNNESSLIYSYDKILNASELFGEVPESTHKGGGGRYILGCGQVFQCLLRGKFLNPW